VGNIDRIVLTVYTLTLAIVSGLMVIVSLFPNWAILREWANWSLQGNGRLVLGLVGATFLAVSVRLITFAFSRRRGGQPVIHETSLGDVRISLDAVENLVRKVARSIKGVRDIKAVITNSKEGLSASLRATISPEVSIPDVSEEIQTTVRQYVKRVVGVEMTEVRLEVENIASESRRSRLD
jgi:uncharacterized alkaline shock family protein YloU